MQRDPLMEWAERGGAGKRRSEEALEGLEGGVKKLSKMALASREVEELPGPRLGSGRVWRLGPGKGAAGSDRDGGDGALFRCGVLVEQALSCSVYADVRFVFDDGVSGVSGHRGMLCGVSGEFRGMFESGMVEAKTGEVRVRAVGRRSFRGFLEFLYLGRPGPAMAGADGREVWLLADLYDVQGAKEWLLREGLDHVNVCAAAQYALEGAGFQSELLDACKGRASVLGLSGIGEASLQGVSAAAAGVVLEGFVKGTERAVEDGVMVEGFEFVQRWARANRVSGSEGDDVESLLGCLDFGKMCSWELLSVVRPSGLVSEGQVDAFCEERVSGASFQERTLGAAKAFGAGRFDFVAVGVKGAEERVAVSVLASTTLSSYAEEVVDVYNVKTGAFIFTLGRGEGHGQLGEFDGPRCVAFNSLGELLVCDRKGDARVCVFDWSGRFVREMGRTGPDVERLKFSSGLAVNKGGDVIVADSGNHRVVVYRGDGTFVRSFGSKGALDGQFNHPCGVAVGVDGRIVVADDENTRVQVFDSEGAHVLTFGSYGTGPGQFIGLGSVAVSVHGEILVTDLSLGGMQLFSQEGEFLRAWKRGDIRGVDIFHPYGICLDQDGRVLISDSMGSLLMLA